MFILLDKSSLKDTLSIQLTRIRQLNLIIYKLKRQSLEIKNSRILCVIYFTIERSLKTFLLIEISL